MSPLEFLAVVLPSSGLYCVAEVTSPKKQHVYTESLEEAYAAAQEFDAKEYDVYFALASFNQPGSRETRNAKNVRSLYLDLDCGPNKSYATQEEAAASLQAFVQRSGFPNPYVVSSGYGLHVYWPYKDETSAEKAKLLATKFKSLANLSTNAGAETTGGNGHDHHDGPAVHQQQLNGHQQHLRLDPAVTGNSSAILRVPGTRNWKHRLDPSRGSEPKHVHLLGEGETVSFERLYRLIEELLPPEQRVPDLWEHLRAPVGGALPHSNVD